MIKLTLRFALLTFVLGSQSQVQPVITDENGNQIIEDNADDWVTFFQINMGMFLRNAVIYELGMKTHFQPLIFPPSPQRAIRTDLSPLPQIRLAPIVDDSTNLGKAFDPNNPDDDNDLQFTRLYGWAQNEGYDWFLVEDNQNRLVWIVDTGVAFVEGDKALERKINNPLDLSPGRIYESDDLNTILGIE